MGPCGGGSEGSRECGFLGLGCRHGFVLNGLGGRRLDGAIGGIRILGRRSVLGNGRRCGGRKDLLAIDLDQANVDQLGLQTRRRLAGIA